jgi:hypothetical protein
MSTTSHSQRSGTFVGYRIVRAKGEGTEYPGLRGKVVKQVKFVNDENYTALNLEFEDNTLASFRLNAKIALSLPPEIARLKGGNLVGWKKLKVHPATLKIHDRND